ncbi:Gfo/Idh/MocA family protein [Thalassoroseus pseudoceratinae]|uniref:Gfo/Idh/MocA family protein n=1 Tax=Thalassoroseus pseudoceratinae TaxID=2713176 RepID=UPI00141E06FF|nr:Gfo/Idh/MocA family oxidoreductase [Thalassoroseus pseudoceratinae]
MSRMNRRHFLQTTAASAAVAPFVISGTKSSGNVIGANDRIRHAVVGINGRGRSHIDGFGKMDDVQVVCLVDPDSRLFDSRSKSVEKHDGKRPKCVQDVRVALEDPDIDTISIATPNHSHSLISIWGCQAGKDVYVEKPLSHNVFEGRQLVKAAKKYDRIVQHGTQNRSSQGLANVIAAVQSGRYGKLTVSKGYCCKPRWSIGTKSTQKPPEGLDFDLWLGPAQKHDYHGNLVHYNWHWFWDFGNGDTGNQGVHEIDVARWAIPDATLPTKVWSLGGRFAYEDQGETPNTQVTVFEYGDVKLLFETRGLVGKYDQDRKVTNEFFTTEGKITKDGTFTPYGGGKSEKVKVDEDERQEVTSGGPFGSFITAVRSRKASDVNCDAEVGHYSSALCHLANISYRLGKSVPFNGRTKGLGENKQVRDSLEKVRENLTAVGVPLEDTNYLLGRELAFDPKTEKFDDPAANEMLSRAYREPFVVPENV